MNKISNLLQSKKSIMGFLLLAALVVNTYKIQDNSGRIKRLTNFESGIQTCFTRVNQTYTAKMLADATSIYLTLNFQNLTEECFAEGILNVEESFKNELSQTAKKLSNLASNVHWFHEDVLSPGLSKGITGNGESRDEGSRFEKIESTKDEILESSEIYKTEVFEQLNEEKSFFYISAILLVILMFSEYISKNRKILSNLYREKEAEEELMDSGGVESVRVGEIIRAALEQNDLYKCSKLFSNYHGQQLFEKNIKNKNKIDLESLISPIGNQLPVDVNEKINKIWNDDSIGIPNDNVEGKILHDLNLEKMNSSVINLLVEKLFSEGIQLDVKIPSSLMIKGRHEEIEQTLYHLLNFAINSTSSELVEKNISICANRLGDVVAFDLIYSGKGFDTQYLKQRAGIINDEILQDVDLQICQMLLSEVDAKIQLDNKIDQVGEISGGRIKIIFKTGHSNVRLVDLKVGSKREIIAGLNADALSTLDI